MKKLLLSAVLSFSVLGNMVPTSAIAAVVRTPLPFGIKASMALESFPAKRVRENVLKRIQSKGFLTEAWINEYVHRGTTEDWIEVLGIAAHDAGLKAAESGLWREFLTGGVAVDASVGEFKNTPPHELSFIVFSALK